METYLAGAMEETVPVALFFGYENVVVEPKRDGGTNSEAET